MKFLTIYIVCTSVLAVSVVQSFKMPSFDEITDLFSSLYSSDKSSGSKSSKKSSKHKRLKRQSAEIGDESLEPFEVRSSALPLMADKATINKRYMPTLGNGYIGTTVYSDKMYLNGLFNGAGSQSHRAAIPALLMSRINLSNPEIERRGTRKYVYNALQGYFMETIKSEYAYIEHKIYLHQKYIRLYVVEINYKLQPVNFGGGFLTLSYPPLVSEDIDFKKPVPYIGNWLLSGTTKTAEKGASPRTVFVFYQQPLPMISISGSQKSANYTFIMSVDTNEANARAEFDKAQLDLLNGDDANYNFFMSHVNEWQKTWDGGRIELSGSNTNQLIKAVWFAQAYILNSLPAENPYLPPPYSDLFYGCGRTSIGKGELGKDYQGHVMWDNEFYILPAILPFHPYMAKQMLRYRSAMGKAASERAASKGFRGYHYPWESAYTGNDVTSDPCPGNDTDCNWRKFYTTSGVALAIRYYISMTRDRDFMINPIYSGCDMSREVTWFLASQLVFNEGLKRYELLDATGPDDYHPRVKNNAFLLCSFSLAIHFARYLSCMCQRNEREEVPDEFVRKAFYLNLPYDKIKRLHYQYEGFDPDRDKPLKMADAILLNHPLNWNYSTDIMRNDLNYYELLTEQKTSSMTLSWFVIGWKWTGEVQKMATAFLKSYQDYIIQPFKIWTENTERSEADQAVGSTNFLPGMGAFLQSLIYGFAGVRIKPDRLEFCRPMPPPNHKKMVLRNFHYLNNNLTFTIENNKVTLEVLAVDNRFPLLLRVNRTDAPEVPLTANSKPIVIEQALDGFFIYSFQETCELPRDYIYMPFGYIPWADEYNINGVPSLHTFSFIFLAFVTNFYLTFFL
ncbi:hypothetical protein HELRODRAFT_193290 [Helobdella robusta]|uniref:Protein-glucosylgalactosylhydroxylysine glucosidase n=1 Tax=Helobdella robusta TaxID=6412 RepID=T1FUU3_HELRO|nr:hypothetical protein HELRODRAFT_193290 [Helobdella robusta]ESN97174.1 hypothetical protein HELRODRAFT_193290 [Helobdella robusta]